MHVVGHETLKDEQYVVKKANKFTVFEILRDFLHCYYVSALSLHIGST